jgi:tRNA(fMet)-specific endonuclease VapC
MSGISYVLDTNALIGFLQGNPALKEFENSTIYLSVISLIEFLSFSNIAEADKALFFEFLKNVEVINLTSSDNEFIDIITSLRTSNRLKLPDAIIAATAIYKSATLITNDKDFKKLSSVTILSY